MVWKYQIEVAPIFYYGISTKINEKDLKIPNLQPPDHWLKTSLLNVPVNTYKQQTLHTFNMDVELKEFIFKNNKFVQTQLAIKQNFEYSAGSGPGHFSCFSDISHNFGMQPAPHENGYFLHDFCSCFYH